MVTRIQSEKGSFVQSPKGGFESSVDLVGIGTMISSFENQFAATYNTLDPSSTPGGACSGGVDNNAPFPGPGGYTLDASFEFDDGSQYVTAKNNRGPGTGLFPAGPGFPVSPSFVVGERFANPGFPENPTRADILNRTFVGLTSGAIYRPSDNGMLEWCYNPGTDRYLFVTSVTPVVWPLPSVPDATSWDVHDSFILPPVTLTVRYADGSITSNAFWSDPTTSPCSIGEASFGGSGGQGLFTLTVDSNPPTLQEYLDHFVGTTWSGDTSGQSITFGEGGSFCSSPSTQAWIPGVGFDRVQLFPLSDPAYVVGMVSSPLPPYVIGEFFTQIP